MSRMTGRLTANELERKWKKAAME